MSERIRWTRYKYGCAVSKCGRFTIEPMFCGAKRVAYLPFDCETRRDGPTTGKQREAMAWCEDQLDRERFAQRSKRSRDDGVARALPSAGR